MGELTAIIISSPLGVTRDKLTLAFEGATWLDSPDEADVDVLEAGLATVLLARRPWLGDGLLDPRTITGLSRSAAADVLGIELQSTASAARLIIASDGEVRRRFDGNDESIRVDEGALPDWDDALRAAPDVAGRRMVEGHLDGEHAGWLRLPSLIADVPTKIHAHDDRLLCVTRRGVVPIMKQEAAAYLRDPWRRVHYVELEDGRRLLVPPGSDITPFLSGLRDLLVSGRASS